MKTYWYLVLCLMAVAALSLAFFACGDDDDDDSDDDNDVEDDDNDADDDNDVDDDQVDDDQVDDDQVDDDQVDDDQTDDDATAQNYALSFNGQGDYVLLGNGDWLNGSYTLEAWVKAANSSNIAHVISSTEGDPWRMNFMLFLGGSDNPGTVSGGHWDGGWDWLNGSTNLYEDYDWHHIAICFNHTTLQASVYVDGVRENQKYFYTAPGQGGDQVVAAGANAAENKSYFRGFMDELRISNAERYTGPTFIPERFHLVDEYTIGLWHFNEGDGLVTQDATGNHFDADIFGPTWVEAEY